MLPCVKSLVENVCHVARTLKSVIDMYLALKQE